MIRAKQGWLRNTRAVRGAIGAAALLCVSAAAAVVQPDARAEALAQARHELAISEQVLARLTERVGLARASAGTRPEDAERLAEYLVRIQALVALNRERVRALERQLAEQPPAASGTGGAGGPTAVTTDAERVAMLDAKLTESLEAFDKLLLDEARKARAREAEAGASGGAAGGGGSGSGKGGASGAESAGAGSDPSDASESSAGGARAAEQGGSPGGPIGGGDPGTAGPEQAYGPRPADIGDGRDDDIVARQIRKAAEAEPDPELRKKLWDEYRKYKQGLTQGANG
jgi:hypothetical protein